MSEELQGSLAPPMANGEVLFEAPWHGRVFGMARALAQDGAFSWDEFRAYLIEAIGEWDVAANPDSQYEYYTHFLLALERLLAAKDLVAPGALMTRAQDLQHRPHGHDH